MVVKGHHHWDLLFVMVFYADYVCYCLSLWLVVYLAYVNPNNIILYVHPIGVISCIYEGCIRGFQRLQASQLWLRLSQPGMLAPEQQGFPCSFWSLCGSLGFALKLRCNTGPLLALWTDVHTRGGLNVYTDISSPDFIHTYMSTCDATCVCVCTVKSFNTSLVFQTMTAKSRPHKAKLTMHPDANKRICLVQRMVEGITCKNHGVAKWQKSPYKWNIAEYQCDISYTTIFPWAKRRSGCTSCEGGLDVSSVEKSHENLLAN